VRGGSGEGVPVFVSVLEFRRKTEDLDEKNEEKQNVGQEVVERQLYMSTHVKCDRSR
jgi:hypothetical protein